ncbi:MAG: NADH-quinone oxidoreductase subunit C [Rhodanobacteraceae bacterium]|nr:NADH-quinone oxidoreductase subunit C [Rhodanobacteraceae bacterium]
MMLTPLLSQARPLPGAPGAHAAQVDISHWRSVLGDVAAGGGRLVSLWAETPADTPARLHAAVIVDSFPTADGSAHTQTGLLQLSATLAADQQRFPSVHEIFPSALRMERAIHDLHGLRSDAWDTRSWLRHTSWSDQRYPLRDAQMPIPTTEAPADAYEFVRVDGDGVHEIAVGPVHAGIIEPGHFRFSVVGEKVLRLEQHLGYVHKGIERRFQELPALEGHRLAARISGDSAVAFSWAYCQALEACAGVTLPPRAACLRALALELERCANHLGDLGALGNDAGFAFALSQFGRLKERLLRLTAATLGQRYLFDYVVPGGTAVDPEATALKTLAASMPLLAAEVQRLHGILDEHAGVRDRFSGAGIVTPALALQLGLAGLAGRASGQAFDLRIDLPCPPYGQLAPKKALHPGGDVAARVAVRFDELLESCRLIGDIASQLPAGDHRVEVPVPAADLIGLGCIEGWRGPVLIALRTAKDGRIARCHPHDPSWHNWPVLEHAVIGNIVPDFPLINKSFNLSYSGHDL